LLVGVSISVLAFSQRIRDKAVRTASSEKVDTSVIAIIPFRQSMEWLFDENYKSCSLTKTDIIEIENLLDECITDYNNKFSEDKSQDKLIKENYKRQYVAAINKKGEKEIWINCLCQTESNRWKKSVILVADGGSCYFNLKVNLTKKKYYNLIVNGLA